MSDETMNLFLKITRFRMIDHYLPKLVQCLEVVPHEDLWHKGKNENSIGGIVLHICEHINRHIERYFTLEKVEHKTGIEHYFPDSSMTSTELIGRIKNTFAEWEEGMNNLIGSHQIAVDMHSFYHLVEHIAYHLGQVVDRAQRITGKPFNFVQNGIHEKSHRDKIENS